MKTLIKNREEALAAHEVARARMMGKTEVHIYPIQEGRPCMVGHKEFKD